MQAKDTRIGEVYAFGRLVEKLECNARQSGYEPYFKLVFEYNGVRKEIIIDYDDIVELEPQSAQNHRRS